MRSDVLLKGLLPLLLLVVSVSTCAAGFSLTSGGVAYRDLRVGSGAAVREGDVVTVHLTGWAGQQGTSDQAFFNTQREGRPLQFLVGTQRVLAGWNEGVQGMRPGGRRLLRIPPELGIGPRSFEDKVPSNATLVFLIELLEVRPAAN
jgi:FKBP-type peptidyl-prolyl cis-trans isomerase